MLSGGQTDRFLTAFLVIVATVSCASSSSTDPEHNAIIPQQQLVVVGGGKPQQEIRKSLLELSPVPDPNMLIIPHAAGEENLESSGQRNVEIFKDLGIEQVAILDLAFVDKALADIADCNVIWMSGGSQSRLMKTLEDRAKGVLIKAIREKAAAGTPIGGSSAGAAVMSEVMISSSYRDEDTGLLTPRISQGLGLWPEVIIDQHFSQRNRFERLEIAIRKNPDLTGVGIDERTAVIYDGTQNSFRVIGEGTVTIVRVSDSADAGSEFEETILEAGDVYEFTDTLTP